MCGCQCLVVVVVVVFVVVVVVVWAVILDLSIAMHRLSSKQKVDSSTSW